MKTNTKTLRTLIGWACAASLAGACQPAEIGLNSGDETGQSATALHYYGWQRVDLEGVEDTSRFGFVIDHFAYWGIALPGFPRERQPAQPSDPGTAPTTLRVKYIDVYSEGWTGGNFSVLATRTPPLFHAYHHKTDEAIAGGHGGPFERRAERNVVERPFSPRNPLIGRGRDALVQLFDATFDEWGHPYGIPEPTAIAFSQFDTRAQIQEALGEQYFETQQMGWNTDLVGPLNALWLVILKSGMNNTPISRLEGGYRLWHQRGHTGNLMGYNWVIWQKDDFNRVRIDLRLAGDINAGLKESPWEDVHIAFELEWE